MVFNNLTITYVSAATTDKFSYGSGAYRKLSIPPCVNAPQLVQSNVRCKMVPQAAHPLSVFHGGSWRSFSTPSPTRDPQPIPSSAGPPQQPFQAPDSL
jgi:hypothetical protein